MPEKLSDAVRPSLEDDGFDVTEYAGAGEHLAALPRDARLLLDPAQVVTALADCVPAWATRIERPDPVTAMKATKGDAELQHVRQTMRRNGAALVQAFHIENALLAGQTVTELDVEAWLHEARAARPGFFGESFNTIGGYMNISRQSACSSDHYFQVTVRIPLLSLTETSA